MKVLLVWMLIVAASASKYVYNTELKYHYKYHNAAVDQEQAFKVCRSEGAEMFFPTTTRETQLIVAMAPQQTFWLGLKVSAGRHRAIDGTTNFQCSWVTGNETCATMTSSNSYCYHSKCSAKYGFICKRGLTQDNIRCNSKDDGYVYNQRANMCYKPQSISQAWYDAVGSCRSEGAKLLIVEDNAQANQIKRLMPFDWEYSYLGIHDNYIQGSFRTIDNRWLKDLKYKNFSADQPDNYLGVERCLAFDRQGQMNDIACAQKYSYFCQKTPIADVPKYILNCTTSQ